MTESLNLSLAFTLVEEIEDPVTLLKPVIGLEPPNESLQLSFPLLVEEISSKLGACVGSLPSLDAPLESYSVNITSPTWASACILTTAWLFCYRSCSKSNTEFPIEEAPVLC